MTATRTPVEVAHAHMIVESHRRMVDAGGRFSPDELLEAAEVLADDWARLRAVEVTVYRAYRVGLADQSTQPAPPTRRARLWHLAVVGAIGAAVYFGLWELGGWVLR